MAVHGRELRLPPPPHLPSTLHELFIKANQEFVAPAALYAQELAPPENQVLVTKGI